MYIVIQICIVHLRAVDKKQSSYRKYRMLYCFLCNEKWEDFILTWFIFSPSWLKHCCHFTPPLFFMFVTRVQALVIDRRRNICTKNTKDWIFKFYLIIILKKIKLFYLIKIFQICISKKKNVQVSFWQL